MAERRDPPNPLFRLAIRLVPGIGRVRAQTEPFARAWRVANEDALRGEGPLWVALGDSMTQGIGAQDISGGWVGQLHESLAASGHRLRLVNLSVTGARIRDVVADQLPRLRALPTEPALVTVLIGANDMLRRKRRATAVADFTRLLDGLPATGTVLATLPQRVREATEINSLIARATAAGRVVPVDMRGGALRTLRGTLAEDFFHPNEHGYSSIAAAFGEAVEGLPSGPVQP